MEPKQNEMNSEKARRGEPPSNWQDLFVEAFTKTPIVERACKAAQVGKTTFYKVLANDREFRTRLAKLKTCRVGFFEDCLTKQAKRGDTTAIIFALKCLARSQWGDGREELAEIRQMLREIKDKKK